MSTETEERPRVYLDSVHLKGFKSIEDLTIDFKKGLNILIGKNGAGKSNFSEFIYLTINHKIYFNGQYKYAKLNFESNDGHLFSLELERELPVSSRKEGLNKIALSEKFSIDDILVYDDSENRETIKRFEFNNRKIRYTSIATGLFHSLGYQHISSSYLRYNLPSDLGSIESQGTISAHIDDGYIFWTFPESLSFLNGIFWSLDRHYNDGDIVLTNLTEISSEDILTHLKLQEDILDNLRRFSTIEDVRFNNNINLYHEEKLLTIENVKIDFQINGNWLPWSQLSDGTRRLFYIISELTYADGLALVEEPELGIHPHQFTLLMDFLKEQSEDKQIIISTHSPKALDHLSPDELDHILIAYYDLDKGTQIRHLSDKEIKKAQKYMKEVGFFSDYWMLSDLE
ncbi:AAA family ATPase [Mucilaginibacter sp. AW1-7]|uniref:AAA family ATPase n=1 Tax=Mucilaginibacter sp. AW1-7 TaxID=3349874 RepID=UPI003F73D2C4